MSGTEHRNQAVNPDELEVAPGSTREALQGWIPALASDDDTRLALEKAFNYRGDVTITRKDGTTIEGYVFDRRPGTTLQNSFVRVVLKETGAKSSIPYSDIAGLEFTGRDTAAGISWEAWVKKYWEKKAAGEKNFGIDPEPLEE